MKGEAEAKSDDTLRVGASAILGSVEGGVRAHALWSNAALAAEAAAGVVLTAIATRAMPTAHFGTFVFAVTLVELLAYFDFGLYAVLPRAVIEAAERHGRDGVVLLVGAAVKIAVAISGGLALIMLIAGLIWRLATPATGIPASAAFATAVIVVSGTMFMLVTLAITRVYEAQRRYPTLARSSIALSLLRLTMGVLVLEAGYGVMGLAIVYAGTMAARCMVLYVCRSRVIGGVQEWSKATVTTLRPLFAVSKWSAVENTARHFFFKADVFVLGTVGSLATAAMVGVGRRIPNLIWQAVVKGAGVSLPAMAAAHVQRDEARQRAILLEVSSRLLQITLPAVAFCWLIAPDVIRLWVGPGYEQSIWAMRWALAGTAVLPLSVPAVNALYAANHVRDSAHTALGELFLLAVCAPLTIWWLGPVGIVPLVAIVHILVTLGWLVPAVCNVMGLSKLDYLRIIPRPVFALALITAAGFMVAGTVFPNGQAARRITAAAVLIWLGFVSGIKLQRESRVVV